jgi:multiple sugar transport system permease protein
MTQVLSLFGRFIRQGLAILAVLIVLFSFAWHFARPFLNASESADTVELVLMNWSGGGGQKEEQIVKDLIDTYQQEHPYVSITRINPGDAGSYNTKLQTMMAAGVTPDIFYMASERFAKFAASGHLADIEALIAADRAANEPTLALEDFFQNVVDSFRFDGQTTGQGTLFGLPKDFTTWGFYYNKTLFDQAGLTYPNDLPDGQWTWDTFAEYARRLNDLPTTIGGAEFSCWDDPIRAYLWTYGLDIVDPDFNSRAFEPAVHERLRQLYIWRHGDNDPATDLPHERILVSGDSQVAQGQDIFVTGKVGMVGPLGRWVVPTYRDIQDFDWDFAPLPQGTEKANLVATVAWSLNAKGENRDEAWKLLKYLCGPAGQQRIAELGLAIPTLKTVAYSSAFVDPNERPVHDEVYLEQAEYARIATIPGYPEWKTTLSKRLEEFLRSGKPMDVTLKALEADWQRDRANPLRAGDFPQLPWSVVLAVIFIPVGLGAAILGTIWWRRRPDRIGLREELSGFGFVSPWVLGFVAFMAFPIVMSLVLAFSKWDGYSTLGEAEWVGLANFRKLLFDDPRFWNSLWVTAFYAAIAVPVGQALALGMAMLLNHDLKASGFFRSALYLPSVLAGVGIAILWRWVFDGEVGLMNTYLVGPVLDTLSSLPGINAGEAPRWFTGDANWFGPPAFAIMSFWALGGTMVIYLAGLKGIPKELYEAAAIDGSNLRQRFTTITLPMLSPIIFFNCIMAVIGSFQVFTQAFVMTAGGPGDDTRFYVLYLYNLAFDDSHMGYASAMAWLLLVLILGLTLLIMYGSRRVVYYEALK